VRPNLGRYGVPVPTIVDKKGTVELLRGEFSAVAELGAGLATDQWERPTCLPGWSVRDALSHMIGTESMLLGEPAPTVEVAGADQLANPVARANEVWVESMRSVPGPELLERFADVTRRRLAVLDAMDQDDFDAPSWTPAGRDETFGRFMRIRHYDCFMHEHDMRHAVGAPARLDAPDLDSALDEVTTGLGYIVGRKAGMPDGSRVRIDLHGGVERTMLVAVDGRAAVVDELAGPPTVGVAMPVDLFLRLTGGRADGVDRIDGEVAVSGDAALAHQLVANLAFTI
jgi:uncharacterized protein (TIGR03083 family)